MRSTIDDKFIQILMDKTGLSGLKITSDALGFLSWAISEVEKGNKIISVHSDVEVKNETNIILTSLEAVKPKKLNQNDTTTIYNEGSY